MMSSTLKSQLSSLTDEQLSALHHIYLLRRRETWLRSNGWLNLVLGALTLWLGSAVLQEFSFSRLIQFVFAILMIAQSLWMIWRPNNLNILSFGSILLFSGGWNLLLWINSNFAQFGIFSGILGLFQLSWAYGVFKEFHFTRHLIQIEPPLELIQLYDEAWQQISRGTLKNDPDTIRFWVAQFRWRGLLLENVAAFAMNNAKFLIILPKDVVQFEARGRNPFNKRRVYGQIKLFMKPERAMMNKQSFQKYAEWKGLETVIAQSSPTYWERLPRAIRIILYGILALIVLYLCFMVVVVVGAFIQYG